MNSDAEQPADNESGESIPTELFEALEMAKALNTSPIKGLVLTRFSKDQLGSKIEHLLRKAIDKLSEPK